MDCIFCKIIKGEIPNHTVYEDEHVLAFLDINPHAKGHTVVIPKVHIETYLELNEELVEKLFLGVKKVMEKISNVLSPDGFNVGWNEKPTAGQVVPHLHIHIMPRYQDDGGGSMHSIVKNVGDKSVEEVAEILK